MAPAPANRTLLAFDFGLRRIGVAVGDAIAESASALTVIHHHDEPDWAALDALLAEWQPDLILVGYPTHMDDMPTEMTAPARAFAAALAARTVVPVELVDERLSSHDATEVIRDARRAGHRRRTRPGDIDKLAARIIIERWLERRRQ